MARTSSVTRVKARAKIAKPRFRILVIYKKSAYQLYVAERKDMRLNALLQKKSRSVAGLLEAHQRHTKSIEVARKLFKRLGIHAVFRYRSDATTAEDFDLVMTLGGDGTFLWASHLVGKDRPVLAINSAPPDSVGFFCAGDRTQMESLVRSALAGQLDEQRLSRLTVKLDGTTLSSRVLNDLLYCHVLPAATTRYLLGVDSHWEDQKSSGVWVGPSAGSTAALSSAGGRILPVGSQRFQYVVREPYARPGNVYNLRRGVVGADAVIRIMSKIRDGRLFVDGSRITFSVPMGSELQITRSEEPLTLLGFKGHQR